jgi:hypothetical protein
MANYIGGGIAYQPEPAEEIIAAAKFYPDYKVIQAFDMRRIKDVFEENATFIRQAAADSAHRAYLRSKLGMKTGNLFRWATNPQNIQTTIQIVGKAIQIWFHWAGGPIYKRIHQWGGVIQPRTAPYLVFVGYDGRVHRKKRVVMPARPYIQIDSISMRDIENGISDAIAFMAINESQRLAKKKVSKTSRQKRAVEEELTAGGAMPALGGRRLTKHRARKILWGKGNYTQETARVFVDVMWNTPELLALLAGIIATRRRGNKLVKGHSAPRMAVGNVST